MSAVGSRAVMGASRWLEAWIPPRPKNGTVMAATASMDKVRATTEVLVFIIHLFSKD
jgi:hypothetical protein